MSTQPVETIAVLLMAYGGPDKLEDIPAYLADVRHGRPFSQALLEEITERYRRIGGRSPIVELTRAQAAGIERLLNACEAAEQGIRYRTYVGMRHWHPYIHEVVPEILRDGADRLVAVVMAPHYSKMSVGAYLQRLSEALESQRAEFPVLAVESWKDEPAFIAAVADRITEGLARFAERRDEVVLLFTAHSLPERILTWGDPYREEILASVEQVARHFPSRRWVFAFQSQGASEEPWLGPTVEETLDRLAAEGVENVLLVPIGFVCDHVEVLYDVDIEHRHYAADLGIRLERTASLNDHPLLCQAIADVVRRRVTEARALAR
ncbi:ferrochelatase [Thermomicrobiaceae bacterium CFH 74404]|uniref:Ferrochelatase n=1 Tax=Thermalbibacter longus TaxID=2951981 RepID=A0AA42B983_9BACT|nr:ferrochelatase [Thermalbibacter longus]MCM8747812.1 ferrochelatase [Thermalbibacter longus]